MQILSHLGHSIDYNIVCQIETAEAEKALQFYEKDDILCGLEPANETSMVLTYFWADNFDQDLERQTGHGLIDSTHIVQFAENSESTKSINLISSMERSKRGLFSIKMLHYRPITLT